MLNAPSPGTTVTVDDSVSVNTPGPDTVTV